MIVNAFSEGLENIPASEYALDQLVSSCPLSHDHEAKWSQNDGSLNARAQPLAAQNTIQKQAVAALMNEVEKENREGVSYNGQDNALQRIQLHGGQPPSGSWAQVAGSVTQYMQPMPMNALSLSKQSQNSDDEEAEYQMPLSGVALPSLSPELPEAKAGIVRIHGKISKDIIQFITTRIHEGPLQDIRIESNDRTRITFQHISQALVFLKSNQDMEQMLGFGRFGNGYRVELAEIVDWNEDHRRMNQPVRERRRLSFARKRLFADNMSPEKWKSDIRTLAGPGNIDFLWVFNSGNATAVFTSTIVARKVLEVFNKWKNGRNVYNGVSVTFSSDPCEKELVLVKETTRPAIAKNLAKRSIR
ncbi:hypothetical protein AWENTII_009894 [Aspergillus wentii]